jgi:hypothetical protein
MKLFPAQAVIVFFMTLTLRRLFAVGKLVLALKLILLVETTAPALSL